MDSFENNFSNSQAAEMAHLTCELAKSCDSKERYFASLFNLTPAEFKCLRLFKNTKVLSIKEMISHLNITPGRITHILTSLETKKFITRKIDPTDKRNVQVTLTSRSEPFIKNLYESHIKLHEDILEKIEPEKRETVILAMKEVISALNLWSKRTNIKHEVEHV